MDLTPAAVESLDEIIAKSHGITIHAITPEERLQPLIAAVPNGVQVVELKPYLDKYLPAPVRRAGTARLATLESLIAHVNRHKDADSVLFGNPDPKAPTLLAVFDYNLAGPARAAPATATEIDPTATNRARFGYHRAAYAFPISEEWKAWSAHDGEPMSQADFARFLEDRIADVAEPVPEKMGPTARDFLQKVASGVGVASPARLLALSRDFAVHAEEKVRTAVNLQTGETVVQYEAQHVDQQGQPVKVPGAFLLGLPVFRGGALYEVAARLRYRKDGPQIRWSYSLYRVDLILDHALSEAFEKAREETSLPLFVGTPEA